MYNFLNIPEKNNFNNLDFIFKAFLQINSISFFKLK